MYYLSHLKDFGFYSEKSEEPLEDFEPKIILTALLRIDYVGRRMGCGWKEGDLIQEDIVLMWEKQNSGLNQGSSKGKKNKQLVKFWIYSDDRVNRNFCQIGCGVREKW